MHTCPRVRERTADIYIDCIFASARARGNNANLVSRNGHQRAVGRSGGAWNTR